MEVRTIILILVLADNSLSLGPEECYTYKELQDESRSWTYQPRVPTGNDTHLQTGWYRIIGPAGNALKTGYDRSNKYGTTPPYFCGSSYPGTLLGSHPTVEEGMVQMTVCFRRRWCFFENDNCECSDSRTIYVRNCGDYYVYWLRKLRATYRYCTTRDQQASPSEAPAECAGYEILKDKSRSWTELSKPQCDSSLDGWYRFVQEAGDKIQTNCSISHSLTTAKSSPCGATYRGWMPDSLPSIEDGRVKRKVCFSYHFDCSCIFFASLYVRNCGTFYVYRFHGVPLCDARYCGAEMDDTVPPVGLRGTVRVPAPYKTAHREENLCTDYVTMDENDRLWTNYDPTMSKCDATLYGNFRFVSHGDDYQMKEGCSLSSQANTIQRCGAKQYGWLVGRNPTERQGVVQRIVCFSSADDPCDCTTSTVVKVQNCGLYYVYGLASVPQCSARYCMEKSPLPKGREISSVKAANKEKVLVNRKIPGFHGRDPSLMSPSNRGSSLTVMVASVIALLLILIILVTILMLVVCRQPRERLRRASKAPSSTLPPYETHSRPRMSSYSASEFSSMKSLDSRRKRDLFRDIDKSFSDLGSRETVDTYQPILRA